MSASKKIYWTSALASLGILFNVISGFSGPLTGDMALVLGHITGAASARLAYSLILTFLISLVFSRSNDEWERRGAWARNFLLASAIVFLKYLLS